MRYIKVKDEKNLVRDRTTQAILNTDISAVNRHELRVKQQMREKAQTDEINSLKSDIAEIRSLLQQLISK